MSSKKSSSNGLLAREHSHDHTNGGGGSNGGHLPASTGGSGTFNLDQLDIIKTIGTGWLDDDMVVGRTVRRSVFPNFPKRVGRYPSNAKFGALVSKFLNPQTQGRTTKLKRGGANVDRNEVFVNTSHNVPEVGGGEGPSTPPPPFYANA